MKKILILLLAGVSLITIPSCNKKKGCMDKNSISYDSEAEEDDGSCIYAGQGGNVTLKIYPEHHEVPIPSQPNYRDTVFIKYNSVTAPSAFDAYFLGDSGSTFVAIPRLKPGYYYVRATGYDTAISMRVFGGLAITITQSSGEMSVKVPVKE